MGFWYQIHLNQNKEKYYKKIVWVFGIRFI